MHQIQAEIGIPKIKTEQGDENTIIFTVSPLPPGYGTTVGNAFRRVLLSSLPGAAVTGIKVKGLNYEYSTIEGAKETVLDILLNLKDLRITKKSSEPSMLDLKITGGKVTAKDIKTSSDVEILNSDLYITTLEDKSKLEIQIRVEKGVGYVPARQKKEEENIADIIWTDAFFSPVKKVRYDVEATRIGEMTNLDKLTLEIQTDGSITPEDALRFASNILKSYFNLFNEEGLSIEPEFMSDLATIAQKQKEEDAKKPTQEAYTPIEILGLSPRTLNALINGEIGSIEQLTKCTESKLTNLRGFGKKALTEVRSALGERSLDLSEE
ncbi:DNA-directed RNA polymerase subunit alpha [Candidatus Peregrinibacteria bacterium CG11_big_fil_rev_8_21_14_0_20_41_10]|nr:MAG: DNA-directed RNA polymerase subunit alpha [Candidatus Peregrinibacteria bacterium CG11_big_fil_rev_8_21_14_0_20_41_10]PIZ75710.1 MAG: DNA-directed RNA polymerase subunit alpha [Candidatus Peregrinibacteria bacterium CG_4_10_14_0_2_um_filter_41_8]PJC37988.1 MAG: DNA-directed RNA polymerase subunit alpha [Candidatus Peregrinibacteria bacterium CG_4_9_14_0_2_um_filter_41_14]